VAFPGAGEVRLEGRLFGRGRTGVVLAHGVWIGGVEGTDSPDQGQVVWFDLAAALADAGHLALTYNLPGHCPGGPGGCSRPPASSSSGDAWRHLIAAVAFMEGRGVERIVLVGADIGAQAVVYAAPRLGARIDGIVTLSAIEFGFGYDLTEPLVRRIDGSKLFVSGRDDRLSTQSPGTAEHLYAWASEPKQLEMLPTERHGSDLVDHTPVYSNTEPEVVQRATDLILSFLDRLGSA
jgi:pimeloyl-ACP methyl ester carboxylesterase